MKIKLRPAVTHARRAMRGAPYVIRCRGENIDMYAKPELPPSNTPEQLAVRAAWRAGTDAWNGLSPAEKALWSAAAKEAESRVPRQSAEPLNGYQYFQGCAKYRQVLELPLLTKPEAFHYPAELTAAEVLPSADERTYRLRLQHKVQGPSAYRVIVSLAPATVSAGRKADRRNARLIKGYGNQSTVELPPDGGEIEFTDARFAVAAGQRFGIWLRVVHVPSATAGSEFFKDAIRPTSDSE